MAWLRSGIVDSCGVAQGFILAPHLYNIFMSDFPHSGSNSIGLLYADDSLIYTHNESPIDALRDVSDHLHTVKAFYDHWGIRINISKSEAICLRNASRKCKNFVVPESKLLRLVIDGEEIPFKDTIKYLGIHFDKLFKFNKHARLVKQKAYRILGSLSRILWNRDLPRSTKLLLYKTTVRPVILYGFPIWFHVSPTVMKEFEILERKVLRLCIGRNFETFSRRYSNVFIYRESKVTPIALYACDIIRKFISRVSSHENYFVSEIFDMQKDYSLSNVVYLSPIGFVNENQPNYDISICIRPDFYDCALLGTHRG